MLIAIFFTVKGAFVRLSCSFNFSDSQIFILFQSNPQQSYHKPIKSNIIILHSVTNVSKVINHFPKDAKQVFLFLDNDKAGQTATDELTQHFNNFALVKDKRNIFAGYKDFGDYVAKSEQAKKSIKNVYFFGDFLQILAKKYHF